MNLIIFAFGFIVSAVFGQDSVPLVNITQGTVLGSVANDGAYYEFYGIPYADSTSGIHRFQAPLPPPSFQDTFVANRRDIRCVNPLGVGYEGTEDCLVTDVFTATLNNTAQLPVMVWVKGKEFDRVHEHEHELSFKKFVGNGVVIVSLNFRESILGFLCLGTETAPGNAGLKDIIAGLRWVKQNIAQFGGNPDDITLFGHGSGAAAVDLVTLSSSANGLVHKAITQSGNSFSPWAVTRNNLYYAVQVAEALGHEVENVHQLSEVFARTSVAALMAVINELELTDNSMAFAPCVERTDLQGVETVLSKSPYQIMNEGEFLKIPFITGFVDNEGTIRAEEALKNDWLEKMEHSFADFLQSDLKFENDAEELAVAEEIKSFYFRNEPVSMENVDDYISYHGDTMILVSTLKQVRLRAALSSSPVYLYQFSYKGNLGDPFVGPIVVDTAAHSEELAYMFHDAADIDIPLLELDLIVADILIERWTNFAKTGVPYSAISHVEWRPFTVENFYYLRILDDDEISEEPEANLEVELLNPHPELVIFWDEIYSEYFLDAESNWELTPRDDEDDNEVIVVDPESGSGDENPEIEDEDSGNDEDNPGNEPDTDDTSDGEPNSASTIVAYTFPILALFAVLNEFHVA
ncbi:hypothetical protein K1T71_002096 [Dendrolimus kikuchii]|uniref:Uncharacterized protein n=1 Tax=Dendrolimus kikuchii TaxID=765133 RepID=A0ACC1DGI4_9NEOP|nr:hypothetical protein K1T71_002096 [Dendrolimus kikuchii]